MMHIYDLLKRRFRGERFVYPTDFYRKCGTLGFTKTETTRLIKQMEMTGKLVRKPRWFEIDLD